MEQPKITSKNLEEVFEPKRQIDEMVELPLIYLPLRQGFGHKVRKRDISDCCLLNHHRLYKSIQLFTKMDEEFKNAYEAYKKTHYMPLTLATKFIQHIAPECKIIVYLAK